ncbi:MAG TPA: hypothetical protein ACFYED_00045 [Candidatus Tripitaka californicus]|uniref:hypothetical protein n=1 Tax=Candidatus Tripitaka californicus TaxID=3367616 RepID=UPI004028976E
MRFTDIKDTTPGKVHKQWWFGIDERWLCLRAESKPYYRYLTGHKKGPYTARWHRYYEVELEEGEEVVRWVKRGRKEGTIYYKYEQGELKKEHSHQGRPEWVRAWVEKMKLLKAQKEGLDNPSPAVLG